MTPTKCDEPCCGRCRFNLTSYPCIRPTYEVQFADAAAATVECCLDCGVDITADDFHACPIAWCVTDEETGSPPVRPR